VAKGGEMKITIEHKQKQVQVEIEDYQNTNWELLVKDMLEALDISLEEEK
jgi:hypothetical protein